MCVSVVCRFNSDRWNSVGQLSLQKIINNKNINNSLLLILIKDYSGGKQTIINIGFKIYKIS